MGQKSSALTNRRSTEEAGAGAAVVAEASLQPTDLVKELELVAELTEECRRSSAGNDSQGQPGEDKAFIHPFLQDWMTIDYLRCSKVIFIMRGITGSGKTTLARKIQETYTNATICSADEYFSRTGKYEFDKGKLSAAHSYCQTKARQECEKNCPVIIIDNTNVKMWEMNPYVKMASEFDYVVVTVEPNTPWKRDALALSKKSSHGVSLDVIKKKLKDFDHGIPIFYGWFLNETDSEMLLLSGKSWLERCLQVPDFTSSIKEYAQACNIYDPTLFFTRDTFMDSSNIIHCTSKFCGKTATGVKEYHSKPEVVQSRGRRFRMHVVGFVMTSDTFSARLKLTEEQLPLWGQDDHEKPPVGLRTRSTVANLGRKAPLQHSPERSCTASFVTIAQDGADRFRPVSGFGSRAHVTIGCAPGVKPVAAGFDAMRAIGCEEEVAENRGQQQSFKIPGAELRFYGGDLWVLYPDKQIVVSGLFSGRY